MFTLPGTPVLRYGDELGMGGERGEPAAQVLRTDAKSTTHPTLKKCERKSNVKRLKKKQPMIQRMKRMMKI